MHSVCRFHSGRHHDYEGDSEEMALNRWTRSYIVLVIGSILLLVLYPAIPTFAASSSMYGGRAGPRLNPTDSLTTTYGTATISPTSLNGSDQTLTVTIPIEVTLNSGTLWQMQIGLTPLASTNYTLPTSLNVGISGHCNAYTDLPECDWPALNDACWAWSIGDSYYVYPSRTSITASGSTPTMVTVFDDSTGCATGDITFTTSLSATLLARNTYAGTYTSKIQASVIEGP